MTTALITGIHGQDGRYLTDLLIAEGWQVHGLTHPSEDSGVPGATLHPVDLLDAREVGKLIETLEPDHVYNFAAVSSVAESWRDPLNTTAVNALGAIAILDACHRLQRRAGRDVTVVQATSAEIFGEPDESPQTENTSIRPLNPYGATKAFAHHAVGAFRHRGLRAVSAILYNHESPRRPPQFVTRKITSTVAAIAQGRADKLVLGNLDARRDWGWAPDYVRAMFLAASHESASDFVIATGESHSVREFVAAAFAHVGVQDWDRHVATDPAFLRPADATELVGDPTRARTVLGWRPTRSFAEVVAAMVDADLTETAPRESTRDTS